MPTLSTNTMCDKKICFKTGMKLCVSFTQKKYWHFPNFFGDVFDCGKIFVKSLNMPADVLTKALNANKHKMSCELTGLNVE